MDKQPRWKKKPFRVCKILLNIQGLGRSQSQSAYCPDKESPSSQPWHTRSKGQLKYLECFPISGNFCYYNMQFSGCCLKNKIFQPSKDLSILAVLMLWATLRVVSHSTLGGCSQQYSGDLVPETEPRPPAHKACKTRLLGDLTGPILAL